MPRETETRTNYRIFADVSTRWKDNDVYGHINNAVYNAWMDTAVTDCFRTYWPEIPETSIIPVAAETFVTFHKSIVHPSNVETGLRVDRIGSSSVRCGVGIFLRGEGEARAWGHMVHVWVDKQSNRPIPIPDAVRDGLRAVLVERGS